jgi:hypothetical protein
MVERINRQGDERIYQPRIHSTLIREIFKIRQATGLPMTVIIDLAIREYLEKYETATDPSSQPVIQDYERNS